MPSVHEQISLMQQEPRSTHSRNGEVVNSPRFNYKPVILRTWALVSLLALTATLIGLLEFAVKALPHGDVRLPVDSNNWHKAHDAWNSIVGRQAPSNYTSFTPDTTSLTYSNSSSVCLDCTSATPPSAFLQSQEIFTPTAPHATPPGAFLQVSETVTVSTVPTTTYFPSQESVTYYPVSFTGENDFQSASTPIESAASGTTIPDVLSTTSTASPTFATPPSAYVDPTDPVTSPTEPATATPGAAYDFNMAAQHEHGGVMVYTWNMAQVFVGTYLAVLVAVLYRALWSVVHNQMSLIDPFRQMTRSNGARADTVLFSFYHSRSSILDPIKALLGARWVLFCSGAAVLIAGSLPALASEAIWVDTNWECSDPKAGSNNPCPARMTIAVFITRILQAILALMAGIIIFVGIALSQRRTGLPADPSSIAAVASLSQHPGLLSDLDSLQGALSRSLRQAKKTMNGKRYRLCLWQGESGTQCYGIRPLGETRYSDEIPHSTTFINVLPKVEDKYQTVVSSEMHEALTPARKASRFGFRDAAFVVMLLGGFGVILAYYLDYNNDGFNNFFNSNTFGPRFILTGAGTIIVHFWKDIEHTTMVMAAFIRLSRRPSSYTSTIAFSPTVTPLNATWRAVRNRYWLTAAVTLAALSGESLNIVISGIPFSPGQVHSQFLVSTYMSLAILGLMAAVFVAVLICRRQEESVPFPPFTIAAKMSYLAGSRLLDDLESSEWQTQEARDESIRLLKKKYSLEDSTSLGGTRCVRINVHDGVWLHGS